MRFQTLLFGVRFFTVLSLGAWAGVFLSVDPDSAGTPGVALFLGTMFSSLAGVFTLVLVSLSRRFIGDASAAAAFGVSFRQGFLLALLSVSALILSRLGYLSWWNMLLALATVLLIEFSVRMATDKEE